MKKLFPAIISLCIFSGFAFAAFAQTKAVNKKDAAELTEIYREFDKEAKKLETKTIEKYLDESYSIETGKVKLNKKQVLEGVKTFYNTVREISEAKSTIEKIEFVNGNYVLQVASRNKGKIALPDGRIVDFLFTTKSTDFWKKNKELKWRENKQIDRGSKLVIDGKENPTN